MKKLLLFVTVIGLTSCGSDSDSGQSKFTGTFSDSSVSSFSQTSGIAKTISPIEIIVPTAYAASGDISCLRGESVSFEAVALGETIDINTTCSDALDLAIRRKLLEAFISKSMHVEMHEHGNANAQTITFPASVSDSNTMTVDVMGVGNGVSSNCGAKYEFNLSTGTVKVYIDGANTVGNGINSACGSGASDFVNGFEQQIQFRFKEGKVEFNMDNETTFDSTASDTGGGVSSNASYARWCLDANTDSTCD